MCSIKPSSLKWWKIFKYMVRFKEDDTVRCCHCNFQCMRKQHLPIHIMWSAMNPEYPQKSTFIGSDMKEADNFTDNFMLHCRQDASYFNSLYQPPSILELDCQKKNTSLQNHSIVRSIKMLRYTRFFAS